MLSAAAARRLFNATHKEFIEQLDSLAREKISEAIYEKKSSIFYLNLSEISFNNKILEAKRYFESLGYKVSLPTWDGNLIQISW